MNQFGVEHNLFKLQFTEAITRVAVKVEINTGDIGLAIDLDAVLKRRSVNSHKPAILLCVPG
jgi:hypothetical protein